MDNSGFESLKRDMATAVHDIFDKFEENNNRLPSIEEFRNIFADYSDHYLGPLDQQVIDGINTNLERKHIKEQQIWDAINEIVEKQRAERSE